MADIKRSLDFPEVTLRRAAEGLAARGEIMLVKRGRRVHLEPSPNKPKGRAPKCLK